MKFDIFFYEAFAEEQAALAARLSDRFNVGYSVETIQRSGHTRPLLLSSAFARSPIYPKHGIRR
ncbi:MAG: hypothetical protein M5U15_04010 [Kiritimatiellae bacterium]|nr:hypothetical protein [Kiritimatiellia bacterium]